MINSFRNILIPLDFSVNTEIAVKKAIELAESETNIYLLYVYEVISGTAVFSVQRLLQPFPQLMPVKEIELKLNQWKACIEESNVCKKVYSLITTSESIQDSIAEEAKKISADLIIVGKSSSHSWFPFLNNVIPSRLSRKSGTAVLTVKPGGLHSRVKTMIVPVTDKNAMNKLGLICAICKKYPVNIHLLALSNYDEKKDENDAYTLLKLYQHLRTSLNCNIEYSIVKCNNKAKAILNYAKKINADIILVTPGTETKIGWPNKHISDLLPAGSKLQVLAV